MVMDLETCMAGIAVGLREPKLRNVYFDVIKNYPVKKPSLKRVPGAGVEPACGRQARTAHYKLFK